MKNNKILIYDSGLGGLNILYDMKKRFGCYDYSYMSNSKNSPYGGKSFSWLYKEAVENLLRADAQNYGAVIIACNTLSTTVLPMLRKRFPSVPIFGVFPPIEVAKNESTLLLCTERTSKSIYIMKAKKRYKNLVVKPLPHLVWDIENSLLSGREICLENHLSGVSKNFKNVILGCTHFCFLKTQFQQFFPKIRVLESLLGTNDHFQGKKPTFKYKVGENNKIDGKISFILDDKDRNQSVFECLFDKIKF